MIVDMTNVDVVIGIDPDNAKSGVGIVHKTTALGWGVKEAG